MASLRLNILLLAAALSCLGQSLAERIQAMLAGSPARRAFWGLQVCDAEGGEVLAEINAEKLFVPASNTKLFTTALALVRLGPDYRFQTRVIAERPPDASGILRGDLRLVGGGDPTLSNRAYPYSKAPAGGDPLQGIEELAGQIAAAGLRRLEGDVVGDDRAYVWEPYPEGWAVDDALWEYGAPVSALTVNDNTVRLSLKARAEGAPVAVTLVPSLDYYLIDNRLRVERAAQGVRIERLPGSEQLRLWGSLGPNQAREFSVAVADPALYAARALAEALRRRGVAIAGRAVAWHRFANEPAGREAAEGVELARRSSPPLLEVLRVIDKVSQNLHAELVLREVGRVCRREGSREAGLRELEAFLDEIGVPRGEYRFLDGSGLSRRNLVTPAAVVRLLRHMYRTPHREAWLALLPLGGEDGTLEGRFAGAPAARRVHAKTGTLSHVSALAGYVQSGRGALVFSVLANNYLAPAAEIRGVIDRIVLLLAE